MSIKSWFHSKPLWLRSGFLGIAVCIALFLFYLFLYFPIINVVYADHIAAYGGTPAWTTNIPLFTGHLFPLFSHFVIEGTPLISRFCEETIPDCTQWAAKEYYTGTDCVEWKESDPETRTEYDGCCEDLIMTPTPACEDRAELAGFIILALVLIGIYFLIGAALGFMIQIKKQRLW
ncbi:hypothetical protein HYS47_01975, partial [Candidatus Woesearchaeota archaeon]|nr:hypothetical protein [Candidatus Woesearchaeota archaeon]